MSKLKLTTETFLEQIKDHEIKILLDNGAYRHIHCSKGGSVHQHFNIVTYPGYLCVSGDMGNFVFKRTKDMFYFFGGYDGADKHPGINGGYWSEKCEAASVRSGMRTFDSDVVENSIKTRVNDICEDIEDYYQDRLIDNNEDEEELSEDCEYKTAADFEAGFREEVEEYFKYKDMDEYRFISSIEEYESELIPKLDFRCDMEWLDTERPTVQYLWCCHAIVWCIEQYYQQEQAKEPVSAGGPSDG